MERDGGAHFRYHEGDIGRWLAFGQVGLRFRYHVRDSGWIVSIHEKSALHLVMIVVVRNVHASPPCPKTRTQKGSTQRAAACLL